MRRTTPAFLGLFSVLTLFAHQRMVRIIGAVWRRGTANPAQLSQMRLRR